MPKTMGLAGLGRDRQRGRTPNPKPRGAKPRFLFEIERELAEMMQLVMGWALQKSGQRPPVNAIHMWGVAEMAVGPGEETPIVRILPLSKREWDARPDQTHRS